MSGEDVLELVDALVAVIDGDDEALGRQAIDPVRAPRLQVVPQSDRRVIPAQRPEMEVGHGRRQLVVTEDRNGSSLKGFANEPRHAAQLEQATGRLSEARQHARLVDGCAPGLHDRRTFKENFVRS